jgi:aspartate/methionine/tyrosine aminotransferase
MLGDFRLEVYFSRWEFAVRHNLGASDAESMRVADLLAMADGAERDAWDRMTLGYVPTWGGDALRTEIAATYERIEPHDVLCFAGAQEGLWCAMHALLEPGAHAIVTVPNYQSMESVPLALCDGNVTGIILRPENGWAFDPAEIEAAIRPETRLVAVNFPNNPTGAIPPREAFARAIDLCAERGIHFLSDEVYRGLETGERRLPSAPDVYERALSLNVMSKAYGLAGLRVGWIACRDRRLLERMERIKHYLSICNAGPSEVLARIALRNREPILAKNRALIDANLDRLDAFFAGRRERYDWQRPDGGCTAFVRYAGEDGIEAHARALAERAGVLILPASVYRSALAPVPEDRFRLGFGRADLADGLAAWSAFLDPLPK